MNRVTRWDGEGFFTSLLYATIFALLIWGTERGIFHQGPDFFMVGIAAFCGYRAGRRQR